MRVSTRGSRRGAVLVASAVALSMTGCSAGQVGAAATVNGQRIPVADVQGGTADLSRLLGPREPVTQTDVLVQLIIAPFVLESGRRNGKLQPRAEVLKEFRDAKITDPSAGAVTAIQVNGTLQRLANESGDARTKVIGDLVNHLKTADIVVNPRYGTFDPETGAITSLQTNWVPTLSATDPEGLADGGGAAGGGS